MGGRAARVAGGCLVRLCHRVSDGPRHCARHSVFGRVGWDVNERGLIGAPAARVLVGAERHATIDRALRFPGFGVGFIVSVPADAQGRMIPEALGRALEQEGGPTIVCAQAGNVNTGSCDPLNKIADIVQAAGAWLHVDGAFGLWAAASPALRHLVAGVERADSWATDAHKWLNVPYDSGIACCAHQEAQQAAVSVRAGLLGLRGHPVARSIRDRGVDRPLLRSCTSIRPTSSPLLPTLRCSTMWCSIRDSCGSWTRQATTTSTPHSVIEAVQNDGTCWLSGTSWHEMSAMRISISSWGTTQRRC